MALGLLFGLVSDVFLFFQLLFKSKVFLHISDFIMMLLYGISFVCVMIGYSSGEFRTLYCALCAFSLCLYLASVHRIVKRIITSLVSPFHRFIRFLLKKLKISKKSFKKVLHFGK